MNYVFNIMNCYSTSVMGVWTFGWFLSLSTKFPLSDIYSMAQKYISPFNYPYSEGTALINGIGTAPTNYNCNTIDELKIQILDGQKEEVH